MLAKFPKRVLVFYFTYTQEALDFHEYLIHIRNRIYEDKWSLFERVSVNVDVVFDQSKFIYHNDLLTQILLRTCDKSTDELTIFKDIELRQVTNSLYKILVGFFSYRVKNMTDVESIIRFFNDFLIESIRKKIKNTDEGVALVIRKSLLGILAHQKVLVAFNIIDKRFSFVFRFLCNVYKKIFFNNTLRIINNIIDKLRDKTYLGSIGKDGGCILFVDFFTELKRFINEFEFLIDYDGIGIIMVEFVRKHLYVFICHINRGLKENLFNFEADELYILLDGVFFLSKESAKLPTYLKTRFPNAKFPSVGLFKKAIFTLGDVIYNKVTLMIEKEIEAASEIDPDKFDIESYLKSRLTEIYVRLEKLHNYYAIRLLKHVYIRLICLYIKAVKKKSSRWINNNLKENLKEFKDYFRENIKGHSMAHFCKFFDYYEQLVFTTSLDKAELLLAMMVGLLGERLPESVVHAMISSRVEDTFGIQGFKLRRVYSNILEEQEAGDKKINQNQTYKRRINHLLNVFFVCVRFTGRIRLRQKRRSLMHIPLEEVKMNKKSLYDMDSTLQDNLKALFIRRPAYVSLNDNEILADVKAIKAKSVLFKYSLVINKDELFLLDEKSKVTKSFFLSKFSGLQRGTIDKELFLLLSYSQCERLLFTSSKVDKMERTASFFLKVLNVTKTFSLNKEKLTNKNRNI